MSDEDKTVREHWPRATRSTTWWVGLVQFVTPGAARLRKQEIVR
jgi:hypothetical protein